MKTKKCSEPVIESTLEINGNDSKRIKEKIVEALEDEEKQYRVNYKKTVWGFATIYAKSLEEAREKVEERDGIYDDEFDNDSEYEYEDPELNE